MGGKGGDCGAAGVVPRRIDNRFLRFGRARINCPVYSLSWLSKNLMRRNYKRPIQAIFGLLSFAHKATRFAIETVQLNWERSRASEDGTDDAPYGIDRENGHSRALQLIPDDFFWDCVDELAPFGSDEGNTALSEFREWRLRHPNAPVTDCLVWTIEAVGEMPAAAYDESLVQKAIIEKQIHDPNFDDQQYIFTLDASVIATAFGQLADEGKIDFDAKPYAALALRRQIVWAELQHEWPHRAQRIKYLKRLRQVLEKA